MNEPSSEANGSRKRQPEPLGEPRPETQGAGRHVGVVRCAYFPQDPRVFKEVSALVQVGFRVTVYCLRMPGDPARGVSPEPLRETIGSEAYADLAGVRVVRMDRSQTRGSMAARMGMYLGFLLWAAVQLFRTQFRERLDIVQINTLPDFLVFCAVPVKVLGTRVVLDLHELLPELFGSEFRGPLRPALIGGLTFVEKACIAFADRVICPGPSYLEVYEGRGAPVEKFTQIYNVPDESIFQRRGVEKVPNLIIAHGSVIERYGFDLIAEAMAKIVRELPSARLEIIGDGEHMPVVRSLVEQHHLAAHVEFVGRVPLEQMSERLERASVGIVATRVNPFTDRILPNKAYELAALGVPIVASETRGLVAQFGRDGIAYFESGDADDIARVTLAVLRDPAKRAALAETAYSIYEGIRWNRNRVDYQRIFLGLD
ncbi:MAG: glycosyltransferase [Candidatus Eisenbacteria bacterium]|uniref:Glycosyltransferase n=1 Tax=Eiseniibacteriota bacterium TaxID=2212470 RepID=A0A956NE58_UNCEI|nr:glycosyltransferase [Candidatus Eisenbacteria bacterium]